MANYTPETYFLNPAHESIARARYYLKDPMGTPVEKNIFEVFKRVNDYIYQNDPEHKAQAQRLCEEKKIMYAGRPLAQAGTGIKNMFNCYSKHAPVVSERGVIPISEMFAGDKVLTEDGTFQTVVHSFSQGYRETLLRINVDRMPKVLEVTPDHKVLTKRGWVKAEDLTNTDYIAVPGYRDIRAVPVEIKLLDFIKSEELGKEPWVLEEYDGCIYKVNVKETSIYNNRYSSKVNAINARVPVDEDLAKLLGYYLSEGCVTSSGTMVLFTYHSDEKEFISETKYLLDKIFGVCASINPSNKGNWTQVVVSSGLLNNFFKNWIGSSFSNKLLPWWVLNTGLDFQRLVLAYACRGDAHIKQGGQALLTMCNPTSMMQMFFIAQQLGLAYSLKYGSKKKESYSTPVSLNIAHDRAQDGQFIEFAQLVDRYVPDLRYWRKITSIEEIAYGDEVWDISVENNHSLQVAGMVGSNCFVLDIDDSRESISETQRIHFHVQAHGGGTGFNFSKLRPSGSWCKGAHSRASGPEGFITSLGYLSSNISQGGNRSGANLGLLEDWHPGLLKFITKKSRSNWENIRRFAVIADENKFNQWQSQHDYEWQTFNVSVGLSDNFMKQVKRKSKKPWVLKWRDDNWHLWDYETVLKSYASNGDVVETTIPISVCAPDEEVAQHEALNEIPFRNAENLKLVKGPYDLSAYDWFRKICTNAWEDGCPGVIFLDTIRKYHNGEYFNPVLSTNPCGEQPLPAWSVCCLSNLILPEFIKGDDVDWDALKEAVFVLVRSLNWISQLNETGIEQIDTNTKRERRIGLGTIGMHEALIRLSMNGDREYIYSQDSGRSMAKKILKFIKHAAYEASIEISKEFGPFPAFNYSEFIQSKFMKQLLKERPDLDEKLKRYGIAHVTVLTQPPTGTTGTITGYSSGCEPYFAMAYQRNSNVGVIMDGCPSFRLWLDEKDINYSEYNYNLQELRKHKRVPKYFEEAQDISWEGHLAMQSVFSEQMDSSISKTINLPSTATVEDIMSTYIQAYDLNIKSTAVYRDGSKTQILETLKNYAKNSEARPQTVVTMQAPQRPDDLNCDIHAVSVKGDKWKLLVGLLHGKPYEIFCFPEEQISIPSSKTTGQLQRNGHGRYNLIIGEEEDAWTIKNVAQLLLSDEHRMITRLLSTSLRHGAPLSAVLSQLSKCDGDVTTFSKAILRVLKRYITDEEYLEVSSCRSCGSKQLVMEQGCLQCADCGYSACD